MPITARFVVQSTIVFLTIGFMALLGVVGTTFWLTEKAQVYQAEAGAQRDIRVSAVELRNALVRAEASQRGYLIGGNEIYLAPYDSAKATAERELQRLRMQLAARQGTERMLTRLGAVVEAQFDELDRTTKLKRDFNDAEAMALFRTNRAKALSDKANLFLSAIIRATEEKLAASSRRNRPRTRCGYDGFRLRRARHHCGGRRRDDHRTALCGRGCPRAR